MPESMDIEIGSDRIKLQRKQWESNVAYISNYPGLLDEVKKIYLDIYRGKTSIFELFCIESVIAQICIAIFIWERKTG